MEKLKRICFLAIAGMVVQGCQFLQKNERPSNYLMDLPMGYYVAKELTKGGEFNLDFYETKDLAKTFKQSSPDVFFSKNAKNLNNDVFVNFKGTLFDLSNQMATRFISFEENALYSALSYGDESYQNKVLTYIQNNAFSLSNVDEETKTQLYTLANGTEILSSDMPTIYSILEKIAEENNQAKIVLADDATGIEFWFKRQMTLDKDFNTVFHFSFEKQTDYRLKQSKGELTEVQYANTLSQSKSEQQLISYQDVQDNQYIGYYWLSIKNVEKLIDHIYSHASNQMSSFIINKNKNTLLQQIKILKEKSEFLVNQYTNPFVLFVGDPSAYGVFDSFGDKLEVGSLLDSRTENKISKNYQRLYTYLSLSPVRKIVAQKGVGESVIKQLLIEFPDLEVYYLQTNEANIQEDASVVSILTENIEVIANAILEK